MPPVNINNIRIKLLTPFVFSLIVIFIGIQTILYFFQQGELNEFTHNLDRELSNAFNQSIERESKKISGFMYFIENNKQINLAWKSKDRKRLFELSESIFKKLKKQHDITHFYYHNVDGTNFLRIHSPNKNGDKINRSTLKQSMNSASSTSGIEFGTMGQFVLRVIKPVIFEGKIIGYLELGKEIDRILKNISQIHNFQLTLSVSKDYILSHGLENTKHLKALNIAQDKTSTDYIINQTSNNIPKKMLQHINKQNSNSYFNTNNKSFLISSITLKDFNGIAASKLTYLFDISNHEVRKNKLSRWIFILNFITGVILFTFYNLYSSRIERTLSSNYKALKNEIKERKSIEENLIGNTKKLEALISQRNTMLNESKKRYRTLFDNTADALIIFNSDKIIDCNQAFLNLFLYSKKEEIFNLKPTDISPKYQEDGELSSTKSSLMIQLALDKGSHHFEWSHKRKNNEVFPAEILLTKAPTEGKDIIHAVVRDISVRKNAEKEIKFRAYYDSLTSLANRQLLLDRLEQSIISCKRKNDFNALLFIDIDRFKTINDTLGHSVGDLLLIEIANRIKSCIREDDTAARFGGDEFVILLKHLGHEQEDASLHGRRIARDIQKSFSRAFTLQQHTLDITSSIGVCIFPIQDEACEDIIKNADSAMYNAKQSGRNRVSFYLSTMHESVIESLTIEKDLRKAIKKQQLEVYYQPQINNLEQATGVEALIRWQHPENGFINPEEFISIAEDAGMIHDIGEFVLHKAISDILTLKQHNCMPKTLSINISPYQFKHTDFIQLIKNLIHQYQLPTNFLTLEITEGVTVNNLSETSAKFKQLRELGVRMSLDDFGTGYSSLSYLKKLPLDELKIDKSFVLDMMDEPHDAQLVQTIINIAHQFGLSIVAEGVETKDQLNFLKDNCCNIYQGYHYSQALPIDQLKDFLVKYPS